MWCDYDLQPLNEILVQGSGTCPLDFRENFPDRMAAFRWSDYGHKEEDHLAGNNYCKRRSVVMIIQ
jgi:hypothetical protein